MNSTLAKKLRFSDVVYAIEATPKSLRLWLQRDLVRLHTPLPDDGSWTEYSFLDVAILVLVRTFVRFGVSVPDASQLANDAIRDFFPQLLVLRTPANVPAGALAVVWHNSRLQLFQDGDKWAMRHVALYESELDSRLSEGFDPNLRSGIAALRLEVEPAPVYLSIDVEHVLRTAFERAEESANDGAA